MITQTDWGAGHTHFTGIGASGAFGNGYIPLFAVIGADNECYYNNNYFSSVTSALNLAIESFGLNANMTANVTSGPANLAVQFQSLCTPANGIESWEWDLDGDGEIDSTEEDPYFLYTEQGTYDVTLTITMDGETSTLTNEDYITVTDGSNISGSLSGNWIAGNTYTITGEVDIPEGNELIITEGTEINIENDTQLLVNGLLAADASSSRGEPIIFKSESSWSGIRFFNTQEDNILANCEISNASVSAILVEGDSKVDVIGCKIFDNTSTSLGAAFEVIGSDNVLISQNIIANNYSTNSVGGIKCINSAIEITNNLIVNNSGSYSAIILQNGSDVEFTNNTIANNEANGVNAYTFFILSSDPVIKNCIINDSNPIFFASGTIDVTYTCISGGYEGTGNIDEDPLFAAPTAGDGTGYDGLAADWSLQAGSLCINAGDPDAMYNDTDGTRNDMGAYGGPTPYELEPTDSDDNTVNVAAINSISVYPNPFNPTANIALSINENDIQQPVSVEIFNIKGQLVKTIVNNEIVQNTNFVWNGKDNSGNSTSSGMYFVKLKTATSEVSKKMLLIK
ncbi:MAG: right-handed parallel beta-helix repeat-containing protein [Candidatus Cloacimonetes bacterium]|jgi:PKD repeat protein|nr:right-handed parallel beta-helix repeat-containing protein [Candidatus Cloacimonadota bacterium]